MFETNLRDDRYLPCEGAGALATIQIDLPLDQRDVDPRRISDVVLHMRYTARDGGPDLEREARDASAKLLDGTLLASARHDLADAWQAFLVPAAGATKQVLAIDLTPDRFPFWSVRRSGQPTLQFVSVLLTLREDVVSIGTSPTLSIDLQGPSGVAVPVTLKVIDPKYPRMLGARVATREATGAWSVTIGQGTIFPDPLRDSTTKFLDRSTVDDLVIVVEFSA
jgi:hypothetical protein